MPPLLLLALHRSLGSGSEGALTSRGSSETSGAPPSPGYVSPETASAIDCPRPSSMIVGGGPSDLGPSVVVAAETAGTRDLLQALSDKERTRETMKEKKKKSFSSLFGKFASFQRGSDDEKQNPNCNNASGIVSGGTSPSASYASSPHSTNYSGGAAAEGLSFKAAPPISPRGGVGRGMR